MGSRYLLLLSLLVAIADAGTTTAPTGGPRVLSADATTITDTSLRIVFVIDQPSTARLEYGPTLAFGTLTPLESSFTYSTHIQTMSPLLSGTTYFFRVVSMMNEGGVTSPPSQVFTATTTGTPPSTLTTTADPTTSTTPEPGTTTPGSSSAVTTVPTSTSGTNGVPSCKLEQRPVGAHLIFKLRFDVPFDQFQCDQFHQAVAELLQTGSATISLLSMRPGSTLVEYSCESRDCAAHIATLSSRVEAGEAVAELPAPILSGTDTNGRDFASPTAGLSLALLIGIAVGTLFLVVILIVILVLCCRRRRQHGYSKPSSRPLLSSFDFNSNSSDHVPLVSTVTSVSYICTVNVTRGDTVLGINAGARVIVENSDMAMANEWVWALDPNTNRQGYVPTQALRRM